MLSFEVSLNQVSWIMISKSVLLERESMAGFETRRESKQSQGMSLDSMFNSKEETWTSKLRTTCFAGNPMEAIGEYRPSNR